MFPIRYEHSEYKASRHFRVDLPAQYMSIHSSYEGVAGVGCIQTTEFDEHAYIMYVTEILPNILSS